MQPFTPEQQVWLARYGFDAARFARWQREVRSGALSKANNVVTTPLLAPEPGAVTKLPARSSTEGRRCVQAGQEAIAKGEVGVAVLNGGMATRFGGVVKGIVEVLPDRSFLALAMADVRRAQTQAGGTVQVFLMNSFATDDATRAHFAEHENFRLAATQVHHFTQFVSLRMTKNGEVLKLADGAFSPYGPGHGDFAPALRHSGLLRRFLDQGGKWVFVRNVDNIGARLDPLVLGWHIRSGREMTVELAPKWPEDVGGSPYQFEGRTQLVEQIRYPEGFDPEIVDVFNTNTFTFSAAALDREFDLGWYFVEKKVEDQKAVQIERLIGEMTRFLSCNFLQVRRAGRDSRFLPVKTPDDLESAREEIAEMYAED